jgi:predicted MPP superfamily phosphohydrolase
MKWVRFLTASGAAVGMYALCEPYLFRLRIQRIAMPQECPRLSVLHLSDTHMRAANHRLQSWLETLPKLLGEPPDLVLVTGDLIDDDSGIDPILDCLARLEARLGRSYVLGSHDYYQSRFESITKYFDASRDHVSTRARRADTKRLETGLREDGWTPLLNSTFFLETEGGRIRLAGVDDPYIDRHDTDHIERDASDVLAIGLVHTPDVVAEWFRAGFDLVLAGHTHGGQVRIPGIGALVTNCSLPNALAAGLHRVDGGWLHVSPGLGTGRFAPIRFACRPEATLLQLEPERA